MRDELQKALDTTGLRGRVVKAFVEKHGHRYQVGLAELEDGRKVVVKNKRTGRASYGAAYTREAEHKNLILLQRLGKTQIPEPIAYADGVLVMSFIDGATMRSADPKDLNEGIFTDVGALYRKINDLAPDEPGRFLTFRDVRSVFAHEFELLFAERLALEHLPKSFYEGVRDTVLAHEAMGRPCDIGLIAKDACGHENILVKDGRLTGLIDFEDLLVGPRMLQLRVELEPRFRAALREGYGADLYDRNWDERLSAAFRLISTLRALYNALHETPVDPAWISHIRERYAECARTLGIDAPLPDITA